MNTSRSKRAAVTLLALLGVFSAGAFADHKDKGRRDNDRRREHFDNRYDFNRHYPKRGYYAPAIPRNRIVVHYGGWPYYFAGGAWYRPYGPRFVVVAPPIGIGIPILPPFYTTVWFRGIPYYYADDVYYRWRPERNAYFVTRPW